MEPIGVAILGCGNIAAPYVDDLAKYPNLRLVGAFDLDEAKARELAAKFGGKVYPSLAVMLADPAVQIVANLSIHHAHYATTRQCLLAGRHVHSEKPIALSPTEAWELVETAEAHGVRLSSSPFTWMGAANQALARTVREGRIGTPRMIYAEVNWNFIELWHPNPAPFYHIGAIWDVGVYPITLATAMFGPVIRVRAIGETLLADRVTKDGVPFRIEQPDWSVAVLDMADGVQMRLTSSFYTGVSRQRASIEIHGDLGTVRTDDWLNFDAPVEVCLRGGEWEPVSYPPAGAYIRWGMAIADVAEAIENDRPHRATGRQAAHVVDVLQAANNSMAQGLAVNITSKFERPVHIETPGELA